VGLAKEVHEDVLALAVRDGAAIEQHGDGSRTFVPVTPPTPVPRPTPVTRPAQTRYSD
jgi:hypothetical protein